MQRSVENKVMASGRAAFHNLGCKVNSYETEVMEQLMSDAGYEIVDFSEKADVYVINTCTVTNIADAKSRQMIHRARKQNPEAIIVAAGCYVQIAPEGASKGDGADILIGNNHKNELVKRIEEFRKGRERQLVVTDIAAEESFESMRLSKTREHTRAFVKIQDGCDNFCSYCLIPYARGRVRSRKSGEVLDEIRSLAANGTKEVVLTGIHVSSFGKDTGETLIGLMREIDAVSGIERLRLSSLEPRIITEEFVTGLAGLRTFCPHFHLSLQSGCDKVLSDMNRHYTTAEYMEKCELIRRYFEHPAMTTDVIVGFPGETGEEFETTYGFVRDVGFYELHVFKFSPRRGTKAERLPGQLTNAEKSSRSSRLIELGDAMSQEFAGYYEGREVEVLAEESCELDGERFMRGFTREYVRAYLPDNVPANSVYRGKVVKTVLNEIYVV